MLLIVQVDARFCKLDGEGHAVCSTQLRLLDCLWSLQPMLSGSFLK